MASTPTHLLIHSVDISRPTTSTGSAGGTKPTYASLSTGVKARVQPMSANENERYGGERTRRMIRVFLPGTTDITEKDRITYGSRVFNVTEVVDLQESDVVIRTICEETLP